TPTASGTVTAHYAKSLIHAAQAAEEIGWAYGLTTFDGADIELARNAIAAQMLADRACTHLLFLDSDMDVSRATFHRLFARGHDMAGVIYPKRSRDWARYGALLASGLGEPVARAASAEFVVRFAEPRIEVSEGWCRVAAIGTGCLLIHRGVFERLAQTGGVPRLSALGGGGDDVHDFFGRVTLKDGSRLSEDYAFCARVVEMGGEIWGLADADVGHVGQHDFRARFVDHLAHRAARPSEERRVTGHSGGDGASG
ncbi:MAG: hypothetical protein AAFQ51_15055, partial [Pseudomonadota bacterium]